MRVSNFGARRHAADFLFPVITMLVVVATLSGMSMGGPLILGLLVAGVVLLGLPHGSLDPLVARQLFAESGRFTTAGFLIAYGILAALCVAGWLAAPNIGLCLFLAVSALHFGSDWQQRGGGWGRFAYGACIVTVPALHHAETVRQIYLELGATAAADIVHVSRMVAWLAAAVAFLSLWGHLRLRWRDCLELMVLLIGALALHPLVFFFCYFCLLHSPRHLVAASHEVGLDSAHAIVAAVAPTVGATLLLAALVWRFLPAHTLSSHVLEIVFIGLAALTVPHVLLTGMKDRGQRLKAGVRMRDKLWVRTT